MKSQYTIIYVKPSSLSDEKFAVGLVMSDNEHVIHRFSYQKLNLIKPLFDQSAYSLVKETLNSLEESITHSISSEKLFNSIDNRIMSYFKYMSEYANNHLEFSFPKGISTETSRNTFNILYKDYITDTLEENPIKETQFNTINNFKALNFPRITHRVNQDYNVTHKLIDQIVVPFEVDFIGKNGSYVTGEVFNFEQSINHLHSGLAKYLDLVTVINASKENGKYFIIGTEPGKKFHKQHATWELIRQRKSVHFIDFKEFSKVSSYLESNNVEPIEV